MMAYSNKLSALAVATVAATFSFVVSSQALAQDGQPRTRTLLTPQIGLGAGQPTQQGALPQVEMSPEEKRAMLQLRIMEIEGGRAYVRQACGDAAWVDDYKIQLEKVEVTKRPEAILAFKAGWEESKVRLGPDIASCDQLLADG